MLVEKIFHHAKKNPNKLFLKDHKESVTYYDFSIQIKQMAKYFNENGIEENMKVVIVLGNSVEFLKVYIALLYLNCTVTFIDYISNDEDIKVVINDFNPNYIVTDKNISDLNNLIDISNFYNDSYSELDVKNSDSHHVPLVLYTSGTTDKPKGVVINRENMNFTINSILGWSKIDNNDVETIALPFSHSFGLGQFHCHAVQGGTIYIEYSVFDVNNYLESLRSSTGTPLTPTGVNFLLSNFKDYFKEAASNLKYIIINTSPMPKELTRELLTTFPNTNIYIYYGLTEASRSTYLDCHKYPDKLESVGKPVNQVYVKINEINNEILIKGKNVFSSYYSQNNEDFEWFYTGDIGYIDNDGFLYIQGRIKEQINIDGYKVNPSSIEKILDKHENVKDCAIKDSYNNNLMKNELIAHIILNDESKAEFTINELKKENKKILKPYEYISKYKIVDYIPRNNKGKLKRKEL